MTKSDVHGAGRLDPLSVVVIGNSAVYQQAPARRRREEGVYAEEMRTLLRARGIDAALHMEGGWFDLITTPSRRYEPLIRNHFPDVVIIHYGAAEAGPYLMPFGLLRHLTRRSSPIGRAGELYRRVVVANAWRVARWYRQAMSAVVGDRTWQMRPTIFAAHLTNVVTQIRRDRRPLVLVVDITPAGDALEHFLPGIKKRHETYRTTIAEAVRRLDDSDVRVVPIVDLLAPLGWEDAVPDGLHYSAKSHAILGQWLADTVVEWLTAEAAARSRATE
ncbi:lysophospholipase L1-like esterase [Actinoalloteichus hoggarensis]|uniref:Uncharacterized protein n=1 Tax=Actinoalloteichus hoggarensis TaxID=1470176 RepID=A0A221W4C0_9PSEU|nr:SGNH/GDSL hydrolase family protein [Actinoalloteichus hoggarensis]ASO20688.1 hypothetical protein AHOG_15310 [Actinoalloteichus hoggarensis]MBB5924459.1 lysophospholipase L1-like esterase [Actinoalloteichus hoggarensis]